MYFYIVKSIFLMKKALVCILGFLLLFGCKKNIQGPKPEFKKPELSISQKFPKPKKLTNFSFEKINEWQEYYNLQSFLDRFSEISSNQVLINAIELRDLVIKLKSNDKPLFIDTPSFNSRINILENEALRLADMTLIPSITNEEVVTQTLKIIEVFGSLNEKVNTMFSQKKFEDAVSINDSISFSENQLKGEKKNIIQKEKSLSKNPKKHTFIETLKKKKE